MTTDDGRSWQDVRDEIERSVAEREGHRVSWKDFFDGKSLNEQVAQCREKGMGRQAIGEYLARYLYERRGVRDPEVFRKLKIGISARWAESSLAKDAAKRVHRIDGRRVCSHCDGRGFV